MCQKVNLTTRKCPYCDLKFIFNIGDIKEEVALVECPHCGETILINQKNKRKPLSLSKIHTTPGTLIVGLPEAGLTNIKNAENLKCAECPDYKCEHRDSLYSMRVECKDKSMQMKSKPWLLFLVKMVRKVEIKLVKIKIVLKGLRK